MIGYADVLARKDGTQIAFEVQLSSQTLIDTEERQARYQRDNVRGVWLFRKLPPGAAPRRDLPMFKLSYPSVGAPLVENMPLRSFTAALLSEQVQSSATRWRLSPNQLLHLRFVEFVCWRCHRTCHIYRVDNDGLLSIHGEANRGFRGVVPRTSGIPSTCLTRCLRLFSTHEQGRKLILGQIKAPLVHTSIGCVPLHSSSVQCDKGRCVGRTAREQWHTTKDECIVSPIVPG